MISLMLGIIYFYLVGIVSRIGTLFMRSSRIPRENIRLMIIVRNFGARNDVMMNRFKMIFRRNCRIKYVAKSKLLIDRVVLKKFITDMVRHETILLLEELILDEEDEPPDR